MTVSGANSGLILAAVANAGHCRPSVGPVLGLGPPSIRLRPGPAQSFPVMLGSQGNLGQRGPKHTHRSVVASFQKRKRNPTVGAMLLRWRKPKANPPFTCVNMIPE